MRNLIVAVMSALALSDCATNTVSNTAKPVVVSMTQQVQTQPTTRAITYDMSTRVQPVYPGFDTIYGIQGTVVVMVLVKSDGQVAHARVDKYAAYPELDDAAINAVRQWHFIPGRKNGLAVSGYARIPVNFSVDKWLVPKDWPANYIHARSVLDIHAIPYSSVDDALLAVSTALREPIGFSPSGKIQNFPIRDNQGIVREWWLFADMDSEYAMAVHYVFAGTTAAPEIRVSSLCRGGAGFCDSRTSWLLMGPVFARNSQPSDASSP
ncbi:energy transducer TonB [Rhodanobacter sp. C01]|uniref:energy transducer TonB n=1 Tax=Rhodanobacter sp. C01 TaxID=1945856 RepID=UPI0009840B4C|nr:energy transducer TonB [Rhodanobacter sp. C01]OOG49548.1 hypothetical protein B0E50_05410 [Rhodanobacter sp. C01]